MRADGGATRNRTLLLLVSLTICAAIGGCESLSPMSRAEREADDGIAEKRAFIARNPDHPQAGKFLKELDDPDFQRASRAHTAAAYDEYLRLHALGKHAHRARYWVERLMYYDALTSKKPDAIKSFLKRFPRSRFLSTAESSLQKNEYEAAKKKDDVPSYRAFLSKYEGARSEWTEAATQRLERLLLDKAKASRSVLALERYIFDNPASPYLSEARAALRSARFEQAMRSGKEVEWKAFIRKYEGSKEAGLIRRHMEAEALKGAERSGRVSALERYLARYPRSPHGKRIRSAIAMMVRERNRQVHRWVRVQNAEVEVFRKRKCKSCKPYLRVQGALLSMDPDFSFDVVVQVQLIEKGRRCCRSRRRIKHLRPGESRPFSFPIRGKSPGKGAPPPQYEIGVVSGSAYRDPQAEQDLKIEGLEGGVKSPPVDRFTPVRVPDFPEIK